MRKINGRGVKTLTNSALATSLSGAALFFLSAGCSTPTVAPLTAEQLRLKNAAVIQTQRSNLDRKLLAQANKEAVTYLAGLAKSLAAASPTLSVLPLEIHLHRGWAGVSSWGVTGVSGRWKSFGVPGTHLYLPSLFIREVDYENELAALIALELALVDSGTAQRRAEAASPHPEKRVGVATDFDFTAAELIKVIDPALDMLYRAGFDPRGLPAVFSHYMRNPQESPYSAALIEEFLPAVRQAIAIRTPLRNPIVRSEKFMKIRKKLQRL